MEILSILLTLGKKNNEYTQKKNLTEVFPMFFVRHNEAGSFKYIEMS